MIAHIPDLLWGIPYTLALTAAAFIMGALLGFPLCLLRISRGRSMRALSNFLIVWVRSIPPIVWLFAIYFGVGNGFISMDPFAAAVLGLGLITGANMAEIYRGALAAIHPGQYEAAKALNLSRTQQFTHVILPQMVRVALPSAATYLIGLLKDSAVASTIGVTEIAFQANQVSQATFQGLSVYASAGLLYILISLPIAWASRRIDLVLRTKVSR